MQISKQFQWVNNFQYKIIHFRQNINKNHTDVLQIITA